MPHVRSRPRLTGRLLPALAAAPLTTMLAACLPDPLATLPSAFDLKPPALVEAGSDGSTSFVLRFDEDVSPVEGSFAVDPGGLARATAEGGELRVELPERQRPGATYSLVGDVRDGGGNGSRIMLSFSGFNDHPAGLLIDEVQTARNSSTTRPHRDFVEFLVTKDGNLGGLEFSASNSMKTITWRFPGVEVSKGEVIILHCAPEGSSAEIDETGGDVGISGGIDASMARDFWSKAGGIPDATGFLMLRESPGGRPMDVLFYADNSKTGPVGEGLLGDLVQEALDTGLWESAGTPSFEDAFGWKPSTSRSILRLAPGTGPGAPEWGLSASGGQSPGTATGGP